jgi:protein-S-isoprenylcysteine O-methyltransferase Ste14
MHMIEFALALYIAFFVIGLGVRAWVQHRRTGDSGIRGPSSRNSVLEWVLWALFAVWMTLLLAAPIVTLAGFLECLELPGWLSALGAVVALAGFVLAILAQWNMGASWRMGVDHSERTALVTSGLFALVRNPIFSGLGALAVGYALMVPNALSLAALLLGVIALELHVRCVEEPFLLRVHGDAYREYARRVGRFVPLVGRFPEERTPPSDR